MMLIIQIAKLKFSTESHFAKFNVHQNYLLYGIIIICLLCLFRWMTLLYSRKQATVKQEKEKRKEEDEEREKLVDGEEDSRSKSFSTLLYEDKVSRLFTCVLKYIYAG